MNVRSGKPVKVLTTPTCPFLLIDVSPSLPMTFECSANRDDRTKLISITPNAEDLIVYCARVSNPNNQTNTETGSRLIRYLIKHSHWSPFEMASMTVEINCSRGIAAQILRHRSFSFQEFSQRYATTDSLSDEGLTYDVDLRYRGTSNRQSSQRKRPEDLSHEAEQYMRQLIEDHLLRSEELYKKLLRAGVAPECARFVLPLSTKTRLYMTGSFRSWIHYVQLRTKEDTQLEHRLIAEEIRDILREQVPSIYEATFMDPSYRDQLLGSQLES